MGGQNRHFRKNIKYNEIEKWNKYFRKDVTQREM
jgi:hypothetical protein